jgi:hypothetical protein
MMMMIRSMKILIHQAFFFEFELVSKKKSFHWLSLRKFFELLPEKKNKCHLKRVQPHVKMVENS